MPPKLRIEKTMILERALDITRRDGIEKLSARNLARELSCSTQPIFSQFASMDDLKKTVLEFAQHKYIRHVDKAKDNGELFLNVGMAYISFAKTEPQLFRLLFNSASNKGKEIDAFLSFMRGTDIDKRILQKIDNQRSKLSDQVITDMWLYTHGLASMLTTNQVKMSDRAIKKRLAQVYKEIFDRLS